MIRRTINEINSQFNELEISERIPCNCSECKNLDTPSFYAYSDLVKRKSKNRNTIECNNSYEQVNIDNLLEGISKKIKLDKDQLQKYIAENKIEHALTAIEGFLIQKQSRDTLNDILLLKRNFKHTNHAYNFENSITYEQFVKETNKITSNILEIINGF